MMATSATDARTGESRLQVSSKAELRRELRSPLERGKDERRIGWEKNEEQ